LQAILGQQVPQHYVPMLCERYSIAKGFFSPFAKEKNLAALSIYWESWQLFPFGFLFVPGHNQRPQEQYHLLPKTFLETFTGCPITHGIHCKKSVKTKCQLKGLGGKKTIIHFQR
jgi:hypothetical protein